ncbi:MAG: inositol monophosphatase [bacterium]|nr:inositol monophosphatase [bacterium]
MTPPIGRASLERLARRAGLVARRYAQRLRPQRKADDSLVTVADRAVERFLTRELARAVPAAGITGEEGTHRPPQGAWRFVLDPIDGTAAFVSGLPTWCICIALVHRDVPVGGVIHLPVSGETFSAMGGRAFWNGRPLARLGRRPGQGDPFLAAYSKLHRRYHVAWPGKIRSVGSAAYHAALVARGSAQAAMLGRVGAWDVAAAMPLLAAVGARLEYLGSGPVTLAALEDPGGVRDAVIAGAPRALATLRTSLTPRAPA